MLDKPNELVDAVKNLTINYAKYYESNTATASDAQGNLTHNPKTVTYTSNGNFEIIELPDHTRLAPANEPGG